MNAPESRLSQLTTEQDQKLQTFKDIMQIEDDHLCITILQQNRWDIQQAIEAYTSSGGNTATTRDSSGNVIQGNDVDAEEDEQQPLLTHRSARNTSSYSSSSSSSSSSSLSHTNNASSQSTRGNTSLLDLLFLIPRWLFQVRPFSINPDLDSQRFIDEYDQQYTQERPAFFAGSYQSAVANAFQQSKFLVVYLHSPIHDDTDRFCRQVLSNDPLRQLLNQEAVTWAGKIWDPEAYGLSSQLKASAFPFIALILCESNRAVQIVDRVQGFINYLQSYPTI